MANPEEKKLGRQLLETLDDITALIKVTHDEDRLAELEKVSSNLIRQIGDLVEAKLDSASAEYKAAAKGLHDASATIKDAIRGIDSVINAIAAIGNALELVAELVPARGL